MRIGATVAVLAAVVLAFSVAWLAGEKHRENCERGNRTSCSVLPWDTGKNAKPRLPPGVSPSEIDRLLGE